MANIDRKTTPVVVREENRLVVYVALDERLSPAWIEIFQGVTGEEELGGFEFAASNVVPHHPSGAAVTASIGLEGVEGTGAGDRVTAILDTLIKFVDSANAVDSQLASRVTEIDRAVKDWWRHVR